MRGKLLIAGATSLAAAGAAAPAASAFVHASVSATSAASEAIEEDAPFTIRLAWGVEDERDVVLRIKQQPAGRCARTPDADPGRVLFSERVSGESERAITHTEPDAGDFYLCAWHSDSQQGEGWTFPSEEAVPVRAPTTSMKLSLGSRPFRGMPVAIVGEAEGAPGRKLQAAFGADPGSGCVASSAASPFELFYPGGVDFRTTVLQFVRVVRPPGPGRFLACGWVEEPGDPQAEAADSLAFRVPSAPTKPSASVVAYTQRGLRRINAWVSVRPPDSPFPVERGSVVFEKRLPSRPFSRAGRPVDLAKVARYDICLRGHPQLNVLRLSTTSYNANRHELRLRYLPASDFRGAVGFLFAPASRGDITGYDRERERCVRKPVRSSTS